MAQKSIPPLKLLDAKTYITDLTQSVTRAETRVNLASLVLVDDSRTHKLIEALIEAASRGVKVTIAVDAFTYSELGGFFSPFRRLRRESRAVSRLVRHLRAAGITFVWLGNGYKFNPFAGVTHIKWTVVDDATYIFGGTNLYKDGIESVDYMFKSSHPPLADQISHQQMAIIKSDASRAVYPGYMSVSDYGTVYVDSGVRRESIIYDRLLELAEQAKHVLVVTQYCPSGPLARLLRGKSDIYYNQPRNTPYPGNLLIAWGQHRTGLHSSYNRSTYLHAKFMIFTMPSGEKVTVTGSHNFSHTGVVFGTREVALETNDLYVVKQLESFFTKSIK